MNKCIFCGAEKHDEDILCRNCERDLPSPEVPKTAIITKSEPEVKTTLKKFVAEEEKVTGDESKRAGHRRLLWIVAIVLGFIVFALAGSLVSNTNKYDFDAYVTKANQPAVHPTQIPIPTPVPLGIPVILGNHAELTVIDVIYHDSVYLDGSYQSILKPGFQALDVGVRIVNYSPGETISFRWNNVYVLEENGNGFYPVWGSVKHVRSGEVINPFNIDLNSEEIDGNEIISIDNDAYLRLIFITSDLPQDILFGIGNSPQISFTIE